MRRNALRPTSTNDQYIYLMRMVGRNVLRRMEYFNKK